MAKMKLPKPSAETVAYFERIAPGPPIEARKMFGMPVRFLNGHMLVGLFGDTFMLHLSPSDREECIRAGAKPFAPMGREAKAYVDVQPGTFDDRTLKEWIVRGMRYLGSLPPKLKQRGGPSSEHDGASSTRAASSQRGVAAKRPGAEGKRAAEATKRAAGTKRAAAGATLRGSTARRAKAAAGERQARTAVVAARPAPKKGKPKQKSGVERAAKAARSRKAASSKERSRARAKKR
jgi:hypothetical protein